MKKSPTLLMKELRAIQTEIARLHNADERNSSVPVDSTFTPRYANLYSYEENRKQIKELQKREAIIHSILNKFNLNTKLDGYGITIADALVKIAQLRSEIKVLTPMVSHQEVYMPDYSSRYQSSSDVYKCCYDLEKVKADLKALQQELAEIQVAVDKINLNSSVNC